VSVVSSYGKWFRVFALAAAFVRIVPADVSAQSVNGENPGIVAVRVGIANHFKVGHWTPVVVETTGVGRLENPRVDVTVIDSDGVATTVAARFTDSTNRERRETAIAYTRVGRVGAPIRVRLADGETTLDEKIVLAAQASQSASAPIELRPTGQLLLALSAAPFGLERALPNRDATANEPGRRAVQLNSITELPVDWFGYDAVDVLVISATDGKLMGELASDEARFAAMVRWVELGGNLVILCGGESAKQLLAEGGSLAPLVPGKFVDVVGLSNLGPLEQFAQPADPILVRGRGEAMRVPRLADVEGYIEVHEEGRQPTELPLVVRAARGLGEITFAGVDPASPPLADWTDRGMLLQALLRPYVAAEGSQDESQSLVTRGYNDLSGALRQQLGRSFAGFMPIGFSLVAALAIAYLLVLGPIDYLLVQRWLRQPLAAWVTFPLIVLLFGTGALGLAEWRRGPARPRVNRLELVDVDSVTGLARGAFWATLHSPRAARFDLGLRLAAPFTRSSSKSPLPVPHRDGERGFGTASGQSSELSKTLLSWWGLPGTGVGGMQARGSDLEELQEGYRYAADLESLEGVPVLTSATKSFVARWTAPAPALVDSNLVDQDGFATGSIVNRSGRPLRNARLLYGGWGYWLGNLEDGQQIDVGEDLDLRRVKTIVTASTLGATATATSQPEGAMFSPERATALELLNLMMFFDAAGGIDFAQLPSRVAADLDLSALLKPGMGRAILIAQAEEPGSSMIDTQSMESLGAEGDFAALVFRFVLPVAQPPNER
jgi:hypothetical protein